MLVVSDLESVARIGRYKPPKFALAQSQWLRHHNSMGTQKSCRAKSICAIIHVDKHVPKFSYFLELGNNFGQGHQYFAPLAHKPAYIPIYIASRSELCQYEDRQQLGDLMTMINANMVIILVSLIISTHHWMIGKFQYLLHTTSKFKISFRFENTTLKPPFLPNVKYMSSTGKFTIHRMYLC